MESIINRLAYQDEWDKFYENRIELVHLNKNDQEEIKQFIDNK